MSIRLIESEADKILAQTHERSLARGLQKDLNRVQSVHDFAVGFWLIPVVILEDKGLSVHDTTSRTGSPPFSFTLILSHSLSLAFTLRLPSPVSSRCGQSPE